MATRRAFFKRLVGELAAAMDGLRGRPQFSLSDVAGLPDDTLADIKPMVRPDVQVHVTDQHVEALLPRRREPVMLFAHGRADTFAFNRFNADTPLREIGAELARTMGWDDRVGFAHAKQFFLRLVALGVCVPANPVG